MEVYGFLGVDGCLWVLYLTIRNIAYLLIQEPQEIWEPQKTSEITHLL